MQLREWYGRITEFWELEAVDVVYYARPVIFDYVKLS